MIARQPRLVRLLNTKSAALACFGIAIATLGGVWWPEVAHYWIPTPHYSPATVERSRSLPETVKLDELAGMSFEPKALQSSPADAVAKAELALRGEWTDDFGRRAIHMPFDRADLSAGWGSQQLRFASLEHVTEILRAYEATGAVRFLEAARDVVNAWARYERTAILPIGLFWNDHAIANRVFVLTRYWRLFRHSSLYDPESGRLALEFVGRSGRMLADRAHFTVRTNHGLIQNVALLHIAASFPALPDAETFRKIAIERVRVQLGFYQSAEGVVLEHSAGYHAAGIVLLDALLAYRDLIGPDLTTDLERRKHVACQFISNLVRPDGTLPLIGDTPARPAPINCKISEQADAGPDESMARLALYPVSGYAIIWQETAEGHDRRQGASQTVVAWGNFATRAHKHADDMTVVTWLAGIPMLSGTGYWPYGHPLQDAAHSWRGANSPHFDWEQDNAARDTELLWTGAAGRLVVVDLLRTTPKANSLIRRQVITIGRGEWVILDFAESETPGRVSSVWTFSPQWTIAGPASHGVYELHDSVSGRRIWTSVASTDGLKLTQLKASDSPFGGYVALCMAPSCIEQAVSLDVSARAGSPVVTFLSAVPSKGDRSVTIRRWIDASNWTLCLDGAECRRQLRRQETHVDITDHNISEVLDLTPVPAQAVAKRTIDDTYRAAAQTYPPWRDYYPYRVRISIVLFALFLIQEGSFFAMRHVLGKLPSWISRLHLILRWLAVSTWISIGAWTVFYYLSETA